MANEEHLGILRSGVEEWNKWRQSNKKLRPDLSDSQLVGVSCVGANLRRVNLRNSLAAAGNFLQADLRDADLSNASLRMASLHLANLERANLSGTTLVSAQLNGSNLKKANLTRANLAGAELLETNLTGAILNHTSLQGARFIRTKMRQAKIIECNAYGISVWDVDLEGAQQERISINDTDEPTITVDNLEICAFIRLLLNNKKIRNVIDTIASKAVLILGRFTPDRKIVLQRLHEELQSRDYVPIIFDFDRPLSRNMTETISTLAHLSRFVIADITSPRSVPQELQRIVPDLPSVPIQPIIHVSDKPWGMFGDYLEYPTVLPPHQYESVEQLCDNIAQHVIAPAERMAQGIANRRRI